MTEQQDFWKSKEWNQQQSNKNWESEAQINTKDLLEQFLKDVPREIDVIDCGCNEGYIIGLLHELGFSSMSGIDVNSKAIKKAEQTFPFDSFLVSAIEDLGPMYLLVEVPYELVLHTSVLMHIHPDNLKKAMTILYNLSGKYIFGKELSTVEPKDMSEVAPKWKNQFWTRRFCDKWLELFPDLHVVKKRIIPMISPNNLETEVFLLEKPGDNKAIREGEGSI